MDMQYSKENIEDMLDLISLNTVEFTDKFIPSISLSSENNSNQNSSNKSELNEVESTPKDLFGVSPIVAINPRHTFSSISDKVMNTNQKSGNIFLSPPINVIEEASETSGRYSLGEIKLQDFPEKTPYFEINHENNMSWENFGNSEMQKKDFEVKANAVLLAPNFEDISAIDKLTPLEENSGFSSFDVNMNSSGLLKAPEIVVCPVENDEQVKNFTVKNEFSRRNSKMIEDNTEKNPKILKKSTGFDLDINIPVQNADNIQGFVNNNEKNNRFKQKQRSSIKEAKLFAVNPEGNSVKSSNSFTNLNNESDIILQKKNILKPVFIKRKNYLTAGPNHNDSFVIHSKPQPRMKFSKSEKKIKNIEGRNLSNPSDGKKLTGGSNSKFFISTPQNLKDVFKKKAKPLERPNPYSIESCQATFQRIFNVNLKMVPKNEIGKIAIKKCIKKRKVTVL